MNDLQLERVLDKLDAIDERLAKQGESLARLEERFAAHSQALDEHEIEDEKMRQQVRNLEKWRWTTLGGIMLLTFLLNIFSGKLF